MEEWFLRSISKHMKDKKVTSNRQHRFTKGKVHQNNVITLYQEMTDFKGKKKGLDIVYIAFSKAVDSLLQYAYQQDTNW